MVSNTMSRQGSLEKQTLRQSKLAASSSWGGTITLTWDVTGSGTSSIATTIANDAVTTVKILDSAVTTNKINNVAVTTGKIANNAVTYAKMQAVSTTSKLLGSSSTTTPVQEITLGTNLSMTGTTLNASAWSAWPAYDAVSVMTPGTIYQAWANGGFVTASAREQTTWPGIRSLVSDANPAPTTLIGLFQLHEIGEWACLSAPILPNAYYQLVGWYDIALFYYHT